MNSRLYMLVSGTVFGVVALFHLLRVVKGWDFTMGPIAIPVGVSILGVIGPALLCAWALSCTRLNR